VLSLLEGPQCWRRRAASRPSQRLRRQLLGSVSSVGAIVSVGHSCLPCLAEAPSEAEGEAEGSEAFDLDLDLAGNERDACSTVEERRFSAA
jgi:hypothetical protein